MTARAVADAFRQATGRMPSWMWHVPGRIEIFGKHTDYAGGESLLATVPRGFLVAAAPRDDGRLRVLDVRHGGEVELAPEDGSARRGWGNYAAVTFRRLSWNFPGAQLGADIAIASDLPRAAGVSSSSALVVGLATALVRRSGVDRTPAWQSVIGGDNDLAWYLGCVENGLDFKTLPGTAGVGTHGGSQDHTAIVGCRAGMVSRFSFMPVVHHEDVPMPAGWWFVVMSSGVHADKAGSVRERYNRTSLLVRALVDLWQRGTGSTDPSLGAALRSAPDAETRLRAMIPATGHASFPRVDLERRLAQFITEVARVPAAAAAFARCDPGTVGALAAASHADADTLLGNQIPETNALVRLARAEGAFAASAFGAGFGGSVWALVDDEAEAFGARWERVYREACRPTGHVEWFTCRPGEGVRELSEW